MANCLTAKKSAGGKGSIAEQLVDNKIDVLMGGGKARYDQATDAGPTVLSYAQSAPRNYRLVQDAASMNAITSLSGGPVLGLFAPVNMTPMFNPLVAAAAPAIAGGPTTRCTNADRVQPARPVRDDAEGDLAAGQPQRVLPPGRERDGRQAGARLGHLRGDR